MTISKKQVLLDDQNKVQKVHRSKFTPDGCFGTVMIGGTGSGKTFHLVFDVLQDRKSTGYLVYTTSTDQPILKTLDELATERNIKLDIIDLSSTSIDYEFIKKKAADAAKDHPDEISYEVIFDDIVHKDVIKQISPLFTSGRHFNISPTIVVHKWKNGRMDFNEIKENAKAFYSFGHMNDSQIAVATFIGENMGLSRVRSVKFGNEIINAFDNEEDKPCIAFFPQDRIKHTRVRAGHWKLIGSLLEPRMKQGLKADKDVIVRNELYDVEQIYSNKGEEEEDIEPDIGIDAPALSNREIEEKYNIKTFMSDEKGIKEYFAKKDTLGAIINTGNMKKTKDGIDTTGGVHWVLLYKLNSKLWFYFDSFGSIADEELITNNFADKQIIRNDIQIQNDDTALCGYYCIAVYNMLKTIPYYNLYQYFEEDNPEHNIETINKFIE